MAPEGFTQGMIAARQHRGEVAGQAAIAPT
jgi:hypothetical protein